MARGGSAGESSGGVASADATAKEVAKTTTAVVAPMAMRRGVFMAAVLKQAVLEGEVAGGLAAVAGGIGRGECDRHRDVRPAARLVARGRDKGPVGPGL